LSQGESAPDPLVVDVDVDLGVVVVVHLPPEAEIPMVKERGVVVRACPQVLQELDVVIHREAVAER